MHLAHGLLASGTHRKKTRHIYQTGHVKHWVRAPIAVEEEHFVEANDRLPLLQGPRLHGGGGEGQRVQIKAWKQIVEEFPTRRLQAGVEKGIQRGVYIDY
jgi:hypothetical protein